MAMEVTNEVPEIVQSIAIEVSPERVFKAWTTPDEMVAWYHSEQFWLTKFECDLREGGKWSADGMTSFSEMPFKVNGTYKKIDAPNFLSFTWADFQDGGHLTTIDVKIEPTEKGSLVTLHHYGFRTEESRANYGGWAWVLSLLRNYFK